MFALQPCFPPKGKRAGSFALGLLSSVLAVIPSLSLADNASPPAPATSSNASAATLTDAPGLSAGTIPAAINNGARWAVTKTEWTPADEDGYTAFVQAIGRSDCTTLGDCLAGEANPYRHTDKRRYSGDCADMAYMLRAYYAWKNALPFSYQSAMRTANGIPEDLRYSTSGNVVTARRNAHGQTPISAPGFIARIGGEVSTAMFRTHPEHGGGRHFDDFYPVEISRSAIRPGVIAYDIFGHVGIVYDILEDGRILIVASHPDNSVTRTVYGPNFLRARPELGAGLKAWRPIYLDGAQRYSDGSYRGGTIRALSNSDIAGYSLEQYFGNRPHPSGEWHYGEFVHDGRTLRYYDYVRRRLAHPNFAYNPVDELRFGLRAICSDIKSRRAAVSRATRAGIHLRPHPNRLPPNIYGTYGLWEDYSTPSRDARLKVSFIELRRTMQDLYERHGAQDAMIRYDGEHLPGDLLEAYTQEANACRINYKRSDGLKVRLQLDHIEQRLFDLSFDPYHCPERRWGAKGRELESCTDDATKDRWYAAQRFLRNQAQRTYDVRMDFTVDELKAPMIASPEEGGLGVEQPADARIGLYLARLNNLSSPDSNAAALLTNASHRDTQTKPSRHHYK